MRLARALLVVLALCSSASASVYYQEADRAPTATDDALDGYVSGTVWFDVESGVEWICLSATTSQADWGRPTALPPWTQADADAGKVLRAGVGWSTAGGGATGATGSAGGVGPFGPTGATGGAGGSGPAGATGSAGAAGATGAGGAAGGIGPTGATGAGAAGATGPSGPAGAGSVKLSADVTHAVTTTWGPVWSIASTASKVHVLRVHLAASTSVAGGAVQVSVSSADSGLGWCRFTSMGTASAVEIDNLLIGASGVNESGQTTWLPAIGIPGVIEIVCTWLTDATPQPVVIAIQPEVAGTARVHAGSFYELSVGP